MCFCDTKVLHCLLCICVLAHNGFLLDDIALYFGSCDGCVKVIDLGNRPVRGLLPKKM